MGRSVCESQNGQVIWIKPREIFARYGLDEFGRELPELHSNEGEQNLAENAHECQSADHCADQGHGS